MDITRRNISVVIIDNKKDEHDYSELGYGVGIQGSAVKFANLILESTNDLFQKIYEFGGTDSIITIGRDLDTRVLTDSSFEFRKKWVHFNDFDIMAVNRSVVATLMTNIERERKGSELFSFFTSTYNTDKEVLERLYNSLKAQTYHNWNWWIIDDSTIPETIEIIHSFKDPRINVIKNEGAHGNIGYNKHLVASICDGNFLVEIDHDDEVLPECLETILKASNKYPDADFFYTYAMEEVNGHAIGYGDYFALGFGGYTDFVYNGNHESVPTSADINCYTVRHIVGLPNHVRCWKKNFYHKIGGHNCELTILDDMDILIRTFLYGKMCKIPRVLYIQHEGNSDEGNGFRLGNTTQVQRFPEILRMGRILKTRYDTPIHERILELGAVDDCWDKNEGCSNLNKKRENVVNFNYTFEE